MCFCSQWYESESRKVSCELNSRPTEAQTNGKKPRDKIAVTDHSIPAGLSPPSTWQCQGNTVHYHWSQKTPYSTQTLKKLHTQTPQNIQQKRYPKQMFIASVADKIEIFLLLPRTAFMFHSLPDFDKSRLLRKWQDKRGLHCSSKAWIIFPNRRVRGQLRTARMHSTSLNLNTQACCPDTIKCFIAMQFAPAAVITFLITVPWCINIKAMGQDLVCACGYVRVCQHTCRFVRWETDK